MQCGEPGFDTVQITSILFLGCSEQIKRRLLHLAKPTRRSEKNVFELSIYTPHIVRNDSTGLQ